MQSMTDKKREREADCQAAVNARDFAAAAKAAIDGNVSQFEHAGEAYLVTAGRNDKERNIFCTSTIRHI